MYQLLWPYAALAAPLPLLVAWLAPPARATGALRLPFYDAAAAWSDGGAGRARSLRVLIAALAWIALVLAACRPQWIGDPVDLPLTGRDLMLSVDVSGSMRLKDMKIGSRNVSRLYAVKQIAGEFISRRRGDRMGLLLFGSKPYVVSPLTFDRQTVRQILQESEVGLAGRQTAIGDAIGLALKHLRKPDDLAPGSTPPAPTLDTPDESNTDAKLDRRVLVLLTDGANTAGEVSPVEAAKLAAANGLKVYTIGVGAESMTVRRLFTHQQVNPSADLDEQTLRSIADMTGARYFRARSTAELEKIYALLDQLEPAASDKAVFRPVRELFHWPLGIACALALLLMLRTCVQGLVGRRAGTFAKSVSASAPPTDAATAP